LKIAIGCFQQSRTKLPSCHAQCLSAAARFGAFSTPNYNYYIPVWSFTQLAKGRIWDENPYKVCNLSYNTGQQGDAMNKFLERLNAGEIFVADGATGTNLIKMGLKSGTTPEDLVLDNPDMLFQLASRFVEAGSDIILTCTFGGTRLRMKESKYAAQSADINSRAVELARKAASARVDVLVAGSIGPTGLLLKPYGPLTPDEAFAAYAEQAKALSDGGVDLLVIETMFAFDEATAAFDAARSVTDLPIVVSFSYDRGVRTMMGVKPAQVMKTCQEKGAAVVGANCGTTLENMEKIVTEYAATVPGFPIWAKPNAGLPRLDNDNKAVYDVTPEEMGAAALRNIAAGARIVGGCCGSSPEHVAGIAKAVKSRK
jgi:5-methyltetrahydrofolate--homocysteine methyltransferase